MSARIPGTDDRRTTLPASILLIRADPGSSDRVVTALTAAGHTVEIVEADGGLPATRPDLIVVDGTTLDSVIGACRDLRSGGVGDEVPVLGLCDGDDVEERIAILEAGADDVLAKPIDARELESRVEALLLRFHPAADASRVTATRIGPADHQLIVCFSPKGGVGTTSIAVNIATLANQIFPGRVLLIDLDDQFGQVAMHLDLGGANRTLADVAQDDEALDGIAALRPYVATHKSGLAVIPSPKSPDLGAVITPSATERLLATAAGAWDVVVVDAGSTLDERTLVAMGAASSLVIPVVADLGALKAVTTLIDYLQDTGPIMERATLVLNNMFVKSPLSPDRVNRVLRREIAIELPFDAFAWIRAINQGIPVLTDSPNSSAADALSRLATMVLGTAGAEPAPAAPRWRRFAGRVRRAERRA